MTTPSVIAEAAREYRKNSRGKRKIQPQGVDELGQHLRRAFVFETLDTVPRDVAAAQFALESEDDDYAFLHLQRIVLAVREAARTFNEIRRGEKS